LSTSINRSASPWLGINGQRESQPADTVAFLTVGQFRGTDWATESEIVRIVYTREEDRLLRVVRRNVYGLTDESIDHMNLAVKVKGFNVRYYDRTNNVWADEWDGRARSSAPTAVLIEITFAQNTDQNTAQNNTQNDDTDESRTIREWVSLGVR